jgi:hypothetical protein
LTRLAFKAKRSALAFGCQSFSRYYLPVAGKILLKTNFEGLIPLPFSSLRAAQPLAKMRPDPSGRAKRHFG